VSRICLQCGTPVGNGSGQSVTIGGQVDWLHLGGCPPPALTEPVAVVLTTAEQETLAAHAMNGKSLTVRTGRVLPDIKRNQWAHAMLKGLRA
jgi:hypothetical protein